MWDFRQNIFTCDLIYSYKWQRKMKQAIGIDVKNESLDALKVKREVNT